MWSKHIIRNTQRIDKITKNKKQHKKYYRQVFLMNIDANLSWNVSSLIQCTKKHSFTSTVYSRNARPFYYYFFLALFVSVCVHILPACTYAHHLPGVPGGQMRAPDSLEVEFQVVMATVWVLGVEPRFSAGVTSPHNYWAITPVPSLTLKYHK